MKPTHSILELVAALVLVGMIAGGTGCERTQEPAKSDAPPVDDRTVDPGGELEQAGRELDQSKDEAVAKARARLQQVDRELEQLGRDAEQHGTELQAELREKRRALSERIDRLEQQSRESWQSTRAEVERNLSEAMESLEHELREARKDIETSANGAQEPGPSGAPQRTKQP
ncbi:hypothetical protein [Paraliomyxa miuraensis]|uniref:hypothetical protein n=1 Tax=Paraliomyxa miuraensis TaxID=376150 RepID=UPI0022577938|nr:hypothetical protein [Paraliomyxa miuraensis]MCX4246634.1 hypothetical protein [Paraliomyxa miuraensis]